MMMRSFVLKVVLLALCLCPNVVHAASIDLIKDGRVVAAATALYDRNNSEEFKHRLFRQTLIINKALGELSGDSGLTREQFNKLPNHIRLRVVPKFKQDIAVIVVQDIGDGLEVMISGNTLEHTEKAVHIFLNKYLRDDEIKELEIFADRVIDEKGSKKDIPRPSFKKVNNLILEQKEAEIHWLDKE